MKVYEPQYKTGLDPFDRAFSDLRCGDLPSGTTVRIWCQDEGRYVMGYLHYYGGNPAFTEHSNESKIKLVAVHGDVSIDRSKKLNVICWDEPAVLTEEEQHIIDDRGWMVSMNDKYGEPRAWGEAADLEEAKRLAVRELRSYLKFDRPDLKESDFTERITRSEKRGLLKYTHPKPAWENES